MATETVAHLRELAGGREAAADDGGDRIKVLLTTEGTYPHVVGGVSTWCDQLVKAMPDLDFEIFALMMNPFVPEAYDLPENASLVKVPIWGVEEPAEFNPAMSPRRVILLSSLMDENTARRKFVPLLRPLLEHIVSPEFDPEYFGQLLYQMHVYFRDHDYRASFRTRSVWETFRDVVLTECGIDLSLEEAWDEVAPEADPTPAEVAARLGQMRKIPIAMGLEASREGVRVPLLFDATESLRVLYRLLTPLNYQVPQADVVHATAAAFCGLPGIIAKIERGTPFLVTEHGVFMREQMLFLGRIGFPYHLRRFFIQLVSAVSRTVYHYADQISPVCAYNARWEAANGARREQIHVIYNGTDRNKFAPREVERPAGPTVVMLARLDPLKDVETGLRVAAEVRKQIPDVKFLYYGPAPDQAYEQRCHELHTELELGDTWEWRGATKDPAGALNQGDVVLLSSISEAFPYTVIEAMMCGKPVVATNVGGVPEATGELGRTARIRDAMGLAEGVVDLLRLPQDELAQLSADCRQRAIELFTIEEAMREYRETFEMLASEVREPKVRVLPAAPEPVRLPAAARPATPHALPLQPAPAASRAPTEPAPAAVAAVAAPSSAPASDDATRVPVGVAPPVELVTIDHVRRGLTHPVPSVREDAIVAAVDRLELAELVQTLSRMLRHDPDTAVRMAAADRLGDLLGAGSREAS